MIICTYKVIEDHVSGTYTKIFKDGNELRNWFDVHNQPYEGNTPLYKIIIENVWVV